MDPLFVDVTDIDGLDDSYGTADDGFGLSDSSPCLDFGTSTGAPSTDITGASRPQGGAVDIGAYESW